MPLNPLACFFISSCCGCEGRPGYMTFSTYGEVSRNWATAVAFFWCSLIRTWSVFMPRLARKQSNGLGTVPQAMHGNGVLAINDIGLFIKKPWQQTSAYVVMVCYSMMQAINLCALYTHSNFLTGLISTGLNYFRLAPSTCTSTPIPLQHLTEQWHAYIPFAKYLSLEPRSSSLVQMAPITTSLCPVCMHVCTVVKHQVRLYTNRQT